MNAPSRMKTPPARVRLPAPDGAARDVVAGAPMMKSDRASLSAVVVWPGSDRAAGNRRPEERGADRVGDRDLGRRDGLGGVGEREGPSRVMGSPGIEENGPLVAVEPGSADQEISLLGKLVPATIRPSDDMA